MHNDPTPSSLTITSQAILAYAELTDDFNPIHVDPAFAAASPMKGVIAHGTMSICLLWQAIFRRWGRQAFEGLELDIRFVAPARLGETLSPVCTTRPGEPGHYDVQVQNEGQDRLRGGVFLPASLTPARHAARTAP